MLRQRARYSMMARGLPILRSWPDRLLLPRIFVMMFARARKTLRGDGNFIRCRWYLIRRQNRFSCRREFIPASALAAITPARKEFIF